MHSCQACSHKQPFINGIEVNISLIDQILIIYTISCPTHCQLWLLQDGLPFSPITTTRATMTGTLSLRDQGQRQDSDCRSLRTLAFLLLAGSVRCSLLDDSLSLSVPHLLFFCGPSLSFNVTAMGFLAWNDRVGNVTFQLLL